MYRRVISLAISAAVVLTIAVPGVVSGEEFRRPCADITDGGGGTLPTSSTTSWDFEFSLQTAEPCGGMIYTLYIFDTEERCAAGRPLAVLEVRGSSPTTESFGQVAFFFSDVDDDDTVWVYATSSQGRTVFDRANDTGCTDYDDNPFAKPFG